MTPASHHRTASPGRTARTTDVPAAPPAFPPFARRGPVLQVSGQGAYGRFVDRYFGTGPRPCRTTVMVGLPLAGMLVEVDAQAVAGY
ncbi:RidA family protein [Streptomyces decoyicus]|uniref:RidA family protein n=1 Tax=Streptomyces decoyicus TaxID=249567 RepID=A0ABZ1FA29_9ACTN|nr:RidA family protein [Streptomyces decoyicus]WSB67201.1 RidA family protein [Streptomyces decoyicus]